jgi:beta-glucuronidase
MHVKPKNYEAQIHNYTPFEEFESNVLNKETLMQTTGRQTESLNGTWNFVIDQYATSIRAKWFTEPLEHNGFAVPTDFDFEAWEATTVPSCWNTQKPEYLLYEGFGVYTRTFGYKMINDQRLFLHFDGVQYKGYIFLNKQYLGCHEGGSTPFSVEITRNVKETNRILVVVDSSRADHQVPMTNTDWFNYGGLYRDIQLVRVPQTYIRSTSIHLVPDNTYSKISVEVQLDGESASQGVRIEIPELGITRELSVSEDIASGIIEAKPELWSPDSPKLYTVVVRTKDDKVEERIGFRQIQVVGKEIQLNGKKLFFRGVSCHEDSITGGKYLSPEEILHDMKTAKELGCNYMRLAHYPHSSQAALIADRLGLMLWAEIPVYWAIDFKNPATLTNASNQLSEMIHRDKNRASVVIWSVGNENPDTEDRLRFMKTLAEQVKNEDPTRLVSAACLVNQVDNRIEDRLSEHLDIIGINEYYGWYNPDFSRLPSFFKNSNPDKPVFICEFGGGALAGHRGSVDDLFTEDRQLYIYKEQLAILGNIPYVQGISPWILFDFRCPRRTNRYQRGYNRKGLLAQDKVTRKLAYYEVQAFYKEIADKDPQSREN